MHAVDVVIMSLSPTMNNIFYSEKSVASNISNNIVNVFWHWLRSDESYLIFTRFSGYILQVRWIRL